MEEQKRAFIVLALFALLSCLFVPSQLHAEDEIGQWINHLDFLPGENVDTKFNTVSVRGGGLEITPAATAVNSFVQQGVQVPAGYLVNGVRVCYAQTGTGGSHIDRVILLQLQDPPTDVDAVLDDEITFNGTDPGPVCINTAPQRVPVDPSLGALSLRFELDFVDEADSVVILGVGLLTVPDPDSPVSQLEDDLEQLSNNQERIVNVLNEHGMDIDTLEKELDRLTDAVIKHTHVYKTGRGSGHNNVNATTSTFILSSDTSTSTPTPTPKTEAPVEVKEAPVKAKVKKSRFGFFR